MPVAIITGATSGIGLAIAKALVAGGYAIVANSRNITADHPSVAEIGASDIVTVAGDVGDAQTAQAVIDAALSNFGAVDLLVNNAGIFIPKPFIEYSQDDYEALLSTNVRGFFNLTQRVLRHMVERGTGHIVNITTSLAENPLKVVPSTLPILTKGGLNAITHALALEYADQGVRINAVSPGIIRTPMHPDAQHDFLATLSPMGRMGDAEDVAQAVLYLENSPFVTGEIMHVDGGASVGRW